MVGFVVTPTTEYSSTSDCRSPVRIRSRERSSSQTATPAWESSARFLFCAMGMRPFGLERGSGARSAVAGGMGEAAGGRDRPGRHGGAGPRRLQALAGGGDDGLVGEAELLVQDAVGGAGAVVGEAHDPARVAHELAPAHRDP